MEKYGEINSRVYTIIRQARVPVKLKYSTQNKSLGGDTQGSFLDGFLGSYSIREGFCFQLLFELIFANFGSPGVVTIEPVKAETFVIVLAKLQLKIAKYCSLIISIILILQQHRA